MKTVITISREFGSGGHSIGKLVAERLGYAFYDRELVNQVAERMGFAPEFVEEYGEYASARNSLLFNLVSASQHVSQPLPLRDQLYIEQNKIIRELADQGNCVIVGRCADYILRDYPNALHVFIHADMDSRAKRILARYGETDRSPEKRLNDKDQKRKVYYKNYTGRSWGQAKNYAMCLDSGILGEEACVEMIVSAAR